MTEFKGRHFGVLLVMCCTWAAARVSINLWPHDTTVVDNEPHERRSHPINESRPPKNVSAIIAKSKVLCCTPLGPIISFPRRVAPSFAKATTQTLDTPMDHQIFFQPLHFGIGAPTAHWDDPPRSPPDSPRRAFSVNAYAYSFLRWDAAGTGLAPAGQYGGGQSGLIATIGLTSGALKGLNLLARASVAHNEPRDSEFALGIRWRPKIAWPVTLSAERRFRGIGNDTFALYVAGGQGNIALPAKFKLETYAQAGVVSSPNAGHFFDAQARADRPLELASTVPVHIGAGLWTGGQRGAARLDIGPSLRTEIPVGPTRLRLTADWRFRITGNAAPGNGPALTLSTGF